MNGQDISDKDTALDRIKAESDQNCPMCKQVVWMGFYFDGFSLSDKSGPRSNVLKLNLAAYEQPNKGLRKLYSHGLGADFDPETEVLAAALNDPKFTSVFEQFRDELAVLLEQLFNWVKSIKGKV